MIKWIISRTHSGLSRHLTRLICQATRAVGSGREKLSLLFRNLHIKMPWLWTRYVWLPLPQHMAVRLSTFYFVNVFPRLPPPLQKQCKLKTKRLEKKHIRIRLVSFHLQLARLDSLPARVRSDSSHISPAKGWQDNARLAGWLRRRVEHLIGYRLRAGFRFCQPYLLICRTDFLGHILWERCVKISVNAQRFQLSSSPLAFTLLRALSVPLLPAPARLFLSPFAP